MNDKWVVEAHDNHSRESTDPGEEKHICKNILPRKCFDQGWRRKTNRQEENEGADALKLEKTRIVV